MANSKRPPRPPESKRPDVSSAASTRSIKPPATVEQRLTKCEAELDAMRALVETLRAEVDEARTRVRKAPPPLPADLSEEIISLDEREVTLETARPPPVSSRRR